MHPMHVRCHHDPNELLIRLATFAGIFAIMAAWEILAPRREQKLGRRSRWSGNIGVVILDTVLVRLVFPTTAVGLALVAETRGWGLFFALDLPIGASVLLAVMGLDLCLKHLSPTIYLQHVLFHAVPALWRLHRMHHADLELDVTTGTRFHPIEIILSMGIKLGAVSALGVPAVAVLVGRYHLSRSAPAQARHAKASGDTLRCRSRCRCNAQKMWPAVRKQVRQTGATIATIN